MPELQTNSWPAGPGVVRSYSALPWRGGSLPVVVFLHGAMRDAGHLFHWAEALEDIADVVLIDLPGHGKSTPVMPATIEALADRVRAALEAGLPDRKLLLVGESLGALVAMAVADRPGDDRVRAVLAADPPLTSAKLWNVAQAFVALMARLPPESFVWSLGREVFGITMTRLEERIHYPIVGAMKVPAVIATGDIPLLPPRHLDGAPCLFDPVDRFVVDQLYGARVRIEQVANCGHLLLVDAVESCRAMIKSMLAEHF